MYLRQTPQFVLAILPIIVGFMLSQSKESAYNRVVLLLFIFSIFMFFFAGAILSPSLKPANALPLSFNFLNILKGTVIFVLTSITPVLCLNDFYDKKSLLTYYSTSTITVIAMSLLIVMVLGNQEAMLYRYPEFVLLKRIKIYEFFSNVENLFVIMIVTDFITTIGAGLKNMELNGKIKPTVVIILLCLLTSICHEDISLYINSPGGSVVAGLAIYDTMNFIKSDVSTIVVGMAASMGSFLLAAGTKGKRYALPNSEVMIHEVLGGTEGQATVIKIQADRILKLRDKMNSLLAKHTGKSISKINKDTERDNFLTAKEALEYGLIDKILDKK